MTPLRSLLKSCCQLIRLSSCCPVSGSKVQPKVAKNVSFKRIFLHRSKTVGNSKPPRGQLINSPVELQRCANLRWLACETSPLTVVVLGQILLLLYRNNLQTNDLRFHYGLIWISVTGRRGPGAPDSIGPGSLTPRWLVGFTEGFPSPAAGLLVSRVLASSRAVTFLPLRDYLPFAEWAVIGSHVSVSAVLFAVFSVTSCRLPPDRMGPNNVTITPRRRSFGHAPATSLLNADVTAVARSDLCSQNRFIPLVLGWRAVVSFCL